MRLAAAGMIPHHPREVIGALARVRELGLEGASWHLPELEALSAADVAEVRARFADAGIGLAQLLPPQYESLVHPEAGRRRAGLEALARCMELARELEADNLYVRPGSLNPAGPWAPHPGNHRPEVRARLVESLCEAARRAEGEGVVLAVEGHVVSPIDGPETARAVLEAVASPALRFNLDPVNFVGTLDDAYDASGLLDRTFAQLQPFIQATHLKDVTVEERLVVHISETMPGRGLLDLPALLARLHAACPDRWVIIEHLRPEEMPEAVAVVREAAGRGLSHRDTEAQRAGVQGRDGESGGGGDGRR